MALQRFPKSDLTKKLFKNSVVWRMGRAPSASTDF